LQEIEMLSVVRAVEELDLESAGSWRAATGLAKTGREAAVEQRLNGRY